MQERMHTKGLKDITDVICELLPLQAGIPNVFRVFTIAATIAVTGA